MNDFQFTFRNKVYLRVCLHDYTDKFFLLFHFKFLKFGCKDKPIRKNLLLLHTKPSFYGQLSHYDCNVFHKFVLVHWLFVSSHDLSL